MLSPQLRQLQSRIKPMRDDLIHHRIYSVVNSLPRLRAFTQSHVFAVWDFMSLLKALQRSLTCVELPWLPTSDPAACRLINEIVLGEESDEDGRGGYCSHFTLYRDAMQSLGASTAPVDQFCDHVRQGRSVNEALELANVGNAAAQFVQSTFSVISSNRPSDIAAAFTYGREDVIPDMFQQFVEGLRQQSPAQFERFHFYLERHIHLDADEHGPKALQMLNSICGTDPEAWRSAERAALAAITARIRFWDMLSEELRSL